ncbi:MAG: hypothetical protein P4L85_19670 [Paludisphaera borealis]|uniref:hypothetical protein n=1 Tax=Paludisphaera borealis TaxID=1387353 RepID=UPI002842E83F|nr:hypothetical protein [Paludisphaera borealis]MDR3621579.1 hypothetical protein [Paludisphaera borealis]
MSRWLPVIVAVPALCAAVVFSGTAFGDEAPPLRAGVFAVDASPPVGSPLAYDPTKGTVHPLSCKGVVLIGEGTPVVLCALDWIGVGNDGQREFRAKLAEAAGTTVERVEVHTLHQHDAPVCDFSTDRLLAEYGINREFYDSDLARDVIARTAAAVKKAVAEAKPVTHLGLGRAEIEKVASNRRILGPDGKVEHVRYTACKDPAVRALPEGVIDPSLRMVSLWAGDKPVVAISYYATHPQSYYRTGLANPDFPGIARDQRQKATGVPHIHFNGAGGNIGAGKYNDGAPENRQVLADRVADGMSKAWAATVKTPIAAADLGWETVRVSLPPAPHLDEKALLAIVADKAKPIRERGTAASELVWLRRCHDGATIDVSCLRLGKARVLHLPGELFVEYQLAAQELRPDLFVATAAYGDYGPGYIGTAEAYPQGGYETSPHASLVAPEVEPVLMDAIKRLLRD